MFTAQSSSVGRRARSVKRVILVSPYFVPSSLAGVHRVRLLATGLRDVGWEPTVVTVHDRFYEQESDPASSHLLPAGLRIERVNAMPTAICRKFGLGDVSLRGHLQLRRGIAKLVRASKPDLIFATVLPGYTSVLGAWAKRRFGLPFVLDYQDPWVSDLASTRPKWSKAGIAYRLAARLECHILPYADAITAVSSKTLDTLRQRHLLPETVPVEIIPIGADARDHELANEHGHTLIVREPNTFHISYLGTLTLRMLPALRSFIDSITVVARETTRTIRLHLIGTSGQSNGHDQHNLRDLVHKAGLAGVVKLHPARVGYLDALRTMKDADLLLMVGSTDAHYTASKLFPYWLSGRPILGVFHRASTIVPLAEQLGGVRLVLYGADGPAEQTTAETISALRELLRADPAAVPARRFEAFREYSAAGVAERYASLFDRISVT